MYVTQTGPGVSCGINQLGSLETYLRQAKHWDHSKKKWNKIPINRRNKVLDILLEVARRRCRSVEDIHNGEEDYYFGYKCAFMLFSDAVKERSGRYFAAYIKKHKLGSLVVTEKRRNENSGNLIEGWLWGVDWEELDAHLITKGFDPEKERRDWLAENEERYGGNF